MKHKFYVAPEHYGAANIEDGSIAEGEDEQDALERHVETHMADYDYATELDMIVRSVRGGEATKYHVTIEALPHAWARLSH